MNRFSVFALICALGGIAALVIDNDSHQSRDYIRLPLVPVRGRRAAGPNGSKVEVKFDKSKDNERYALSISVGTPPQSFLALLDTRSTVLWLPSQDCKSERLCAAPKKFNGNASSTYTPTTAPFVIHYLGGDLTGIIAKETVSIGDLTVTDQEFGLATDEVVDPGVGPYDGYIGLTYGRTANSDPAKDILDNMKDQGQISKKVVCIKLSNTGGEMFFGGCDVRAEHWIPVQVKPGEIGTWKVNLTKLEMKDGDKLIKTLCGGDADPCPYGTFDTGDSKSTLPNTINPGFLEGLGTAQCSSTLKLIYHFGKAKVALGADDLFTLKDNKCQPKMESYENYKEFLFGDFLNRKYTLFLDRDNKRVGFANIKS